MEGTNYSQVDVSSGMHLGEINNDWENQMFESNHRNIHNIVLGTECPQQSACFWIPAGK